MAELQTYAKIKVYLDGNEWLETADVSMSRTGNHNQVKTLAKGLSGFVVGAGECSVQLTNYIPTSGVEFNPSIFTADTHSMTLIMGAQSITINGIFMDDSYSGGVDKAVEQSLNFMGRPAELE